MVPPPPPPPPPAAIAAPPSSIAPTTCSWLILACTSPSFSWRYSLWPYQWTPPHLFPLVPSPLSTSLSPSHPLLTLPSSPTTSLSPSLPRISWLHLALGLSCPSLSYTLLRPLCPPFPLDKAPLACQSPDVGAPQANHKLLIGPNRETK